MDNLKRVMVSLPASLLAEVDGVIHKGNRSQFIREAMRLYLEDIRKQELREMMKNGYKEMAPLNLQLASKGLELEQRLLEYYEDGLLESGGSDYKER